MPLFSLSLVCKLLISRTARDSIRKKDFRRLIFHASANGLLIAQPLWGLVSELTLDDNGMRRLHEEKELVLGDQGEKASNFFNYSFDRLSCTNVLGSQEAFVTAV